MDTLLLLLLDSRAPAGAHNHSAGMEAAIGVGMVRGLDDVEAFCRGRLRTSGLVASAFAAAACRLAEADRHASGESSHPRDITFDAWAELDAEFEARTPSAAIRDASRQLGRGLLRLVRAMLPEWRPPWDVTPHHPIVLGATVTAAGGTADLAARAAALATISVPAGAAVRLLGLDPFAVQGMLARLAREIDDPSARQGDDGGPDPRRAALLPAGGAPALDLLADFHLTTEVRLFAS